MSNTKKTATISFVVLLVTGLIVAGAIALRPKENAPTDSTTTTVSAQPAIANETTDQPATTTTPSVTVATEYKDGTYTSTGVYDTPEGSESIGITVTVSNDTVTATSASKLAKRSESKEYQGDFIANYASLVVGKKLSTLRLGNVAGSSLTPIGFNQAIAAIRTQAQN